MIEQEFDKKRNPYKGTLYYSGNGFKNNQVFYESDSDSDEYNGGMIDFGSLLTNVGKVFSDNKDTIQALASTTGKVADMGKSISETVKASNAKPHSVGQSPSKTKTLTPQQENQMFGTGFKVFNSRESTKQ
jgi:hypothetical protein